MKNHRDGYINDVNRHGSHSGSPSSLTSKPWTSTSRHSSRHDSSHSHSYSHKARSGSAGSERGGKESIATRSTRDLDGESKDEINKLTALVLKYELRGQMNKKAEVIARIQEIQSSSASSSEHQQHQPPNNTQREELSMPHRPKLGKKAQCALDASHQSVKFLPSIDQHGRANRTMPVGLISSNEITAMAVAEKTSRGDELDRQAAKRFATAARLMEDLSGNDDRDYAADMVAQALQDDTLSEEKNKKLEAKALDAARRQAMADDKRVTAALHRCWYCLSGPRFRSDLLISHGADVVLLAAPQPMISGQMVLTTREHLSSIAAVDEDVARELAAFRKLIAKMYDSRGRSALFVELVTQGIKNQTHTVIDCFPIPVSQMKDVRPFLREELTNVGAFDAEVFRTHKKMIDTAQKGGIHRSIPAGFQYVHVSWLSSPGEEEEGIAHHIEEHESVGFPNTFGLQLVAGLLEMDPEAWISRKTKEGDGEREEAKMKRVRALKMLFEQSLGG